MVKAVSGGVKSVFILIAGTIITTGVSAQRIPIQYADNASDLMQIIKSNKLVAIMFFEAENEGVRKAVIDAASKEKVSSMEPPLTFVELKNLGAGNPVGINFSPSLKVVTNGELSSTVEFDFFQEQGFSESALYNFFLKLGQVESDSGETVSPLKPEL